MTKKQAKAEGFTHHGYYFGIPVWIGDVEGDFIVATKWAPMECVMTIFHHIEGTLRSAFWPDCDPGFQFWLGKPIEDKS